VRTALLIARKDLRQRLRDRSAFLIALVVPFVLAAIFGLTLHDVGTGHVKFDFAIVDQDGGPAARAFARHVLAPLERQGLADVRTEPSLAQGRHDADRGKVAATFVIPAGFSAAVAAGRPAGLRVLGDIDSPIGALVAHSLAQSFASGADGVRIAVAAARPSSAADARRLAAAAAAAPSAVTITDVSTTRKELDLGTYYAAGMAVFFLFFTVQFGVTSVLDERRDGTLARMFAAPIRRRDVLVGKLLTSLVLGVVSMSVLVVASRFVLGAHWGNPLGVGILIVCGVLAATSVMALVATLAKTPDQAGAWSSIVALVLAMLGGSFFSVSQAGGVLAALSLLTPHAWFLRGLGNLAGGGGVGDVLGPIAAMLAFAAVTGGIALTRMEKLIEP
jgi:ABC-2 type transport system permease protein